MAFNDFMNKVRLWDNKSAKWITRHFYLIFFEIVLVIVFLVFFVNAIKVIDASVGIPQTKPIERLALAQTVNSSIIVMLLLLNSFWMLYMFNSVIRLRSILREINFNLTRRRDSSKNN